MLEIKSRALPLLAISDHIARQTASKYGALVGYRTPNSITLTDSFDLKHDSGIIDFPHLVKKLSLVQTVASSIELLGIYSCEGGEIDPSSLYHQLTQNGFSSPLVYIESSSGNHYRSFNLESGEELAFSLTPGDSEVTAVSTVQNHAHYSEKEPTLVSDNTTHIGPAFHQLEEHVKHILSTENPGPELEKEIVQLAQLVSGYKGESRTEKHEIYASYLSILASQMATSKCADVQANIRTAAIDKRGYRPADEWNDYSRVEGNLKG